MQSFKFFGKFFLAAALIFALLSFNWDRIELENRAFVITIGIDATDEEGQPFEVSMSIADTKAMEKDGQESPDTMRSARGESLAHAMGQTETATSDKIYFGHTKAVVLGEGLLKSEKLLKETIDTLARNNEINIKAIVMATNKKAAEILEAKPKEQDLLGVYLSSFYNNNNANPAAAAVKLDLEGLDSQLLNSESALIPKITLEEGEGEDKTTAISGVAVVRDFALAGYIEEEAMRGFLWLMENGAGTRIPIEVEGGHVTFLTAKSKPKLSFYEEDGRLNCLVKLKAQGSIQGASSDKAIDASSIAAWQEDFAKKIKTEIEESFDILRTEFAIDGLGIKDLLRKKERDLYQEYGSDWSKTFEHMSLVTDIEVLITNTGSTK